ncbi:MAG: type II toxin-antitoxin system VapC family toxin [Treponema sp.]|nr:type II toxin-antitoxin system VapC family toxin [Treponema sp.]
MLYMLDTNIVSYLLEKDATVVEKFDSVFLQNDFAISNIVKYEIQRGIFYRGSKKLQNDFDIFCKYIPVLPITNADFLQAAHIYASLRHAGNLIEDADIFIGASALSNNAILVTNNEDHLGRITGLRIENWTKRS